MKYSRYISPKNAGFFLTASAALSTDVVRLALMNNIDIYFHSIRWFPHLKNLAQQIRKHNKNKKETTGSKPGQRGDNF